MALYEHVYMARQDVTAQQVEALTEQLKASSPRNGGKVAKVEYWGVKSLAYRIKKNRKAHFSLLNIDAPPAAIAEMERQIGINEDVIRFITIRVDAHEEGPSAMMRKRDDDDRDDRGGRGAAAAAAIGPIAATVRIAAIGPTVPAVRATTPSGEALLMADRPPPPILPPPQDLPVLRPERAEDRLQGHAPALALHFRARQDRAVAHHRRFRQEAARTGAGDQARPLPRPAALRNPLSIGRGRAGAGPQKRSRSRRMSRRGLAGTGGERRPFPNRC